jgi:GntR family transcriptional regulator
LSIDRTALAIDGRPVEWRVSLCRTDFVHYLSDLS